MKRNTPRHKNEYHALAWRQLGGLGAEHLYVAHAAKGLQGTARLYLVPRTKVSHIY